ncbi:MAG: DeoR/GlpR transcriptional regulator [Planctomycetales bacterium]|nr:DeoR/GlpR transcriptional regulator [Planctomycetales bacterium]
MMTDERRSEVLTIIRQQGFASLTDLAQKLEVSESTIRRDLDHLEEQGAAQRTHGGAFYTGPSPQLPHFRLRQQDQFAKKQLIARAAAELIEDGDVILLDGGSTTYELAQLLVGRPIQVVTNSLPVANLFTASNSGDLILVGGYVHLRTGVSVGPYANEMLESLNVRRAFLSVAGVSERGYFNSNLLLVETEQAMLRSADESIVLVDSTKFGRQSLANLAELGAVTKVVVDNEICEDWRSQIIAAGVDLIVAGPTDNG